MSGLLAAVNETEAEEALALVLALVGVALILFGAYRAYLRDAFGAILAGLFGLVLLVIFWDGL